MAVDIKKITVYNIIYSELEKDVQKSMKKGNVYKVKYSYGKEEILNTTPQKEESTIDWRKVKVARNENQVAGMTKIAELEATSKGSDRGYATPKSLKTKALIILKKKAASENANYILITSESVSAAFGDIPSATYKGIAYQDDSIK